MSQNSLVLPTSGTLSGLNAVQDINNALDTLNTLASAASAPSSPEAGQLWHDTANKIIKIRSMDNTAWISIGTLNETAYTFAAAGLSGILPLASGGTGASTAAAALAALIGTSVSPVSGSPGTIPLPGGMLANFGQTGTIAASGYNTFSFATAFPNGVYVVLLSVSAPAGYSGATFTYDTLSTSSVNIHNQYSGGALSGSYLVIGH